jgi:hypothetical protein
VRANGARGIERLHAAVAAAEFHIPHPYWFAEKFTCNFQICQQFVNKKGSASK